MAYFRLFGMGTTLFALFVVYWLLLFRLIDTLLEKYSTKKLYRIPVAVINTAIIFLLKANIKSATLPYVVLFTLMMLEFIIFYRDKFMSVLFCASACIIHVLAIMAITTGSLSMITGYSSYKITNDSFLVLFSAIIAMAVLNIAILCVLKLIPLEQVKTMSQYKERQWFIIAWITVNNAYLLYNVNIFTLPSYYYDLSVNQLASAFAILAGLYIVLFLAIKTSTLLEYKEKNVELEQAVYQEQQYRNSIIKDAIMSYEANITKDTVIKGFGEQQATPSGAPVHYSEMLVVLAEKLVHPDDIEEFKKYATIANITNEYESGKSESIVEYRRLSDSNDNDGYIWVRAITNFMKNSETGDLIGFTYIKNVDAEKRNRLELEHKAERDPLTGLYNKVITGKLIDDFLTASKSHTHSALFMIDIDNFKEINDHLGHVYGDAVLGELADKLKIIFRSDDIIGRIGGDEYIAFSKEGAVVQKAEKIAEEIRKAFRITYNGQAGDEYTISGSIGISLFPRDGKSFNELYAHADAALYMAKSRGKDNYVFYDGSSFSGYKSTRTEIHTIGNVSQKGFRENRVEYIFKILYHSENPSAAIYSALELVASHFSFERGYIFETSKDGKTTSNTFEWCAENVTPEIDVLQNIPIEAVATAHASFEATGIFILKSLNSLAPIERALLEPQGIKSMFQFGIFNKNELLGFIGFDNCRNEAIPSDTDIDEMETICNILATFFVKQQDDENIFTNNALLLKETMNNLGSYTYVINRQTFEVLYMNEKAQETMGDDGEHKLCYEAFRGNTEQCSDCPLKCLADGKGQKSVSEVYNSNLEKWIQTTASQLPWAGDVDACLITCMDITKYKNENLRHIKQLEKLAYFDELTGARNYYKFKEDAQNIINKNKSLCYYLVKFDVNNFKLINQIYGYEKGNEALRCIAKAVEQTACKENEIFARIANDEFIALFIISDKSDISVLFSTFQENFHKLMGSSFTFRCTFPHGRYIIGPNIREDIDIMEIFEKVNFAHGATKLSKLSEYTYYDESMTNAALYEKEIEDKMGEALTNNDIQAFLQPKYRLKDGSIGGAEALARWRKNDVEVFSPGGFIPVFEKNGFITKLDMYMLGKICELINGWVRGGITPIVISVNFSRLHLTNPNFVNQLCDIVDSYGVERRLIEIEITETAIFDNIDVLGAILSELHSAGFTMSMDDFGSGYSSLSMLESLEVDVIKIDRGFFSKQKNSERSKTVVGSIIQMAAGLGISIVAEGIEEKEDVELLRELHCDMVQGFYYARPMLPEKLTELIITQ